MISTYYQIDKYNILKNKSIILHPKKICIDGTRDSIMSIIQDFIIYPTIKMFLRFLTFYIFKKSMKVVWLKNITKNIFLRNLRSKKKKRRKYLYTNLIESFRISLLSGSKYILVIVDDKNKKNQICFINAKLDILTKF